MPIDGINNYWGSNGVPVTGVPGNKTGSSALNISDFLSLMVAQLSNQDMYNTMDDTQMMAQMAQFSMVQAMSEMNQMSQTAYSVSLIGKEATVAAMQQNGQLDTYVGIVEGVKLFNGGAVITIDGKDFALSSVMEVKEPKIIIPTPPPEPEEKPEGPEDKPEIPGDDTGIGNGEGGNNGEGGSND